MADRIIKPDSGNDLILQNDDASAKIEINEDGSMPVTGTLEGSMIVGSGKTLNINNGTFVTSAAQRQAIVQEGPGTGTLDVSSGTFTTSSAQKQAIVQAGPGSGTLDVSSGTFTTSTAQKQAIVDGASIASSVPVGSIFQMAFTPGSTWLTTNKFLICDGSSLNSSTDTQYADLYSAIGITWGGSSASAFNIPDLRGAFLRGTGANGTHNMEDGNDYAGPSVGAFESDQNQQHLHNFAHGPGAGTENTIIVSTATGRDSGDIMTSVDASVGDRGSTKGVQFQGGDEARPFNAGIQFIIKF